MRGSFGFNGTATRRQGNAASVAESQLFHSWADFLLGMPAQAGKVDQLRNPNSVWWTQYALYARDHWQIGRRTTRTYGLRWELFSVPGKDHAGINSFDPDTGTVFTGGLSGIPFDSGARSGTDQFLPRVGIAFRWNRKTVLRGGYNLLTRDVSGCKERFPDRQHLVHARPLSSRQLVHSCDYASPGFDQYEYSA